MPLCLLSGPWDATLPIKDLREEGIDASGWHPEWGDRMQELVFIGIAMDEGGMIGTAPYCVVFMTLLALSKCVSVAAVMLILA